MRGACGVIRWERESNESVYDRCVLNTCTNGVKCRVIEWLKRNSLKWLGHVERMGSGEFVKVYESESEGPNRRGKPLGKWKDKVQEYMGERGINGWRVLKQAKRKC